MAIDYKNELNGSQLDAVMYTDGPCMVIAGAGSGKTRVLTYRIAHLLEIGIEPWSILALTFTNKAAGEMKERIATQVGEKKARYLWMGTFHSIFSRILRTEAQAIGYTPNFTIYDTEDSKSLIKSIVKEMQLDDKVYKPGQVLNRISNAKNRLMGPSAYQQNPDILKNDQYRNMGMVGKIYEKYWKRLRNSDAMDFDDLLLNTYVLFKEHPEVLEKYASQFRHVLVDEYQDTNYAQHCIVWQLTGKNQQVCVVGDDAQSIYSFRGANIDNMLKFTKLYTNARIFKLEQNYRSTKNIVGAANSLIDKNSQQIKKAVFSENETGAPIKILKAYSDIEEGELVSNNILDLKRSEGVDYGSIAVLYRTNAQSRIFEESMRKHSLPYKIYGSLSFYQRKEIKNVIAYFRLVINPNDEEAFRRIINYPARGIGDTTLGHLSSAASAHGVSLWQVACNPAHYGISFNQGTLGRIGQFVQLMTQLQEMADASTAFELAQKVIDGAGIMHDLMMDKSPEGQERVENLKELMSGIDSFCRERLEEGNPALHLTDYLSEVSLLTDQDNDQEGDDRKVTLMTVHAAKGLEFDTVFIVGLEENLFPSQMSMENERQIEEERRLFYVAMTRAEKRCFLLYARNRFRYGSTECSEPSRFLKDIDPKYVELPEEPVRQAFRSSGSQFGVRTKPAYGGGYRDSSDSFSPRTKDAFRPMTKAEGFRKRPDAVSSAGFNPAGTTPKPEAQPKIAMAPRNLQKVTGSMLANSRPASADAANGIHVDNIIEHERFGIGQVLALEGVGDSCKAKIRFVNVGEKTLLLKFARFKILK
ncbi:MAG: UvrD-helicase domain-containing protein [Bacteroidaceae bacterium]|nr:UvrD-helicase domain-containing protein [Bacteroidaceae bacterium]